MNKEFKVGQRVWSETFKDFATVIDDSYFETCRIKFDDDEDYSITVFNIHLHQTADDMFGELGFEKSPNSNELYIVDMDCVEFDLETKTYWTSIENITPQLHLAIHQKLIELRWIE